MIKIFNNLLPKLTKHELELFRAAKDNDPQKINELSMIGVNMNVKNLYNVRAAHCAAFNGCKDALVALYKNGADFSLKDIVGDTPFKKATLRENKETAKFISELLDLSK